MSSETVDSFGHAHARAHARTHALEYKIGGRADSRLPDSQILAGGERASDRERERGRDRRAGEYGMRPIYSIYQFVNWPIIYY